MNLNIDANEHVRATNSNQREKLENVMRFIYLIETLYCCISSWDQDSWP